MILDRARRAFVAAGAAVGLAFCGPSIGDAERRQARSRTQLATSMLMQGEFASALREARRSVELDPECTDCRLVLATVYAARSEFDRAEGELRRVIEEDPGNPYAMNTLATVYMNLGRPAEAEPMARRASEDEDFDGRHLAFYNLGWALLEQGNQGEALEAFGQSLRESPEMCLARFRVGEIYVRQGRFEQAISQLEQALEEGPAREGGPDEQPPTCRDMPEAHHIMGLALLGSGRDDEARDSFRRCAELAPEGSEARGACAERLDSREPDGEPGIVPEE